MAYLTEPQPVYVTISGVPHQLSYVTHSPVLHYFTTGTGEVITSSENLYNSEPLINKGQGPYYSKPVRPKPKKVYIPELHPERTDAWGSLLDLYTPPTEEEKLRNSLPPRVLGILEIFEEAEESEEGE